MSKELDKKDWKLLELLCTNARLSHNQIAKKIGLSKNAVTYRIERLQKREVITGFVTIINHPALGLDFYEILLKTTASKQQEQEFITYLQKHPQLLVLDRVSGEWNFVLEFGCRRVQLFLEIIHDLRERFSTIIDQLETHLILDSYKVEQLPVELVAKPRQPIPFNHNVQEQELNDVEEKLLIELSKNATAPLHILAEKLSITPQTVRARLHRLEKQKIILKYTAKINLIPLAHDMYLILLDIHHMTHEREQEFRRFLIAHSNIRYAFLSATLPRIFIYFAAKSSEQLDIFLKEIKERFGENIINQRYMFMREQYKYDLFPEGLLSKK